jgi:hypothetical protein
MDGTQWSQSRNQNEDEDEDEEAAISPAFAELGAAF